MNNAVLGGPLTTVSLTLQQILCQHLESLVQLSYLVELIVPFCVSHCLIKVPRAKQEAKLFKSYKNTMMNQNQPNKKTTQT